MKKVLFILMCLLLVGKVNAKTLSIEEVIEGFMDSTIIKAFNNESNEGTVSAVNNTENSTIDIVVTADGRSEVAKSLSYSKGYIDYSDNREITEQNIMENLKDSIYLMSIFEGILIKSGYAGVQINDIPTDFVPSLETYGYYSETEHYDMDDNNGGHMSGDYIRVLQIGFETDKIDNLINTIGINNGSGGSGTTEPDTPTIVDAAPAIKYKNRKKTSVDINVYVEGATSSTTCDVYRSDDNVDYKKIDALSGPCNSKTKYVTDTGLKEKSLYYYKAVVTGGTKYSPVLKIQEYVKNPNTGVNNVFPLLIGLVLSLAVLFVFRKNSVNQL